jgi:hypothetical protein
MEMAWLSTLIRTVAETSGEPEASVTVIARSLREGGFITTGGRGRSAASMTNFDAASLLLGVGAPGDNTKAAATVARLSAAALEKSLTWKRGAPDGRQKAATVPSNLNINAGDELIHVIARLLNEFELPKIGATGLRRIRPKPRVQNEDGAEIWLPQSIQLETTFDQRGWSADLEVTTSDGRLVRFVFAETQQALRHTTTELRWKRSSVTLLPPIFEAVVRCLRDEPSPVYAFPRPVD